MALRQIVKGIEAFETAKNGLQDGTLLVHYDDNLHLSQPMIDHLVGLGQ